MFGGRGGRGRGRGATVSNDGTRQTTLFAGARPFTRLQAAGNANASRPPPKRTAEQLYNGRGRGRGGRGGGAAAFVAGRGGRGRGRGRGRGGRGAYNNNNPWNRQIQLQQQQRQLQQKKAKTAGNNFDFLPAEEFGEEPRDDEEDDGDGDGDEERDVLLPADQRNHYLTAKRHKFSDAFADNAAFHREWTAFVALYPAALEDIREEMKSEQRRRRRDPLGPRPPSSEAAMEARFSALYESLLFSEFDEGGGENGGGNGFEDPRRTLFVGVHIYVNGWTHPTASQLATLMQLTGGSFAWNFLPGRTTHTIATVLSQAQKRQERARLTTVHPEWILDCLEQRRLLPVHEYKVLKPKNDIGKMFAAIAKRNAEKAAAEAAAAAAAEAEKVIRMAAAADKVDKIVVKRPAPQRAPPSPELINWSEFEMEEEEEKIRKNVQGPVVEDVRKAPQTKSKSKQTTSCSSSKGKGKRETQQVPTTSSSPQIIELIDLGTPPEQPPSRAVDKQKEQQLPTTPVKRASRRRKKPIVHPSPELTFVLNDMAAMDAEEEEEEKRRMENGNPVTSSSRAPEDNNHQSLDLSGPDWPRKPSAPPAETKSAPKPISTSTSTSTSTSAISKTSTSGPNLLGALDPSREAKSKEKTTTAKSIFTALPPSTNRPPNEKPRVKPTFRRAGERRKFDAASLAGKVIKPKIPLDVQEYFRNLPAADQPTVSTFTVARPPPPETTSTEAPRVVPPLPPPPQPPVPALPQQPPPPQRPLYEQPKRLPPSELRFREFKRKLERGDERHFVPADDYMPASMSAVDAEVLAALPEDMQREMRAFVRQKAAAKEPPPAAPKPTTAGRGRGRGRGRGGGVAGAKEKAPPPGQVTLSGWVVRAPPPAPLPAAHPPRVQLKRKAITSSNWPELDPDLRLGSSLKLRRSGGSNGCRDSVESPRRCWNEEEVLEIVLSGEEDEDNDLQLLLMSRSGEGPSTSISAAADDEVCSKCHKVRLPEKKTAAKKSENNRSIPTTTIDPSHPKAPKKQPVKSQAKVDQMLQAFQEKRKKFTSERKTAAEKALALLSGHLDRRLGPNLVGRRRLPAVCALLRQWITSSLKEEELLDDDLAYLLRYFSALIDAGRQDDLLVVLHRCKDYLGERERRMASENTGGENLLDSWRTAFYETFPAFLRQEPDFRELIPEELFWYAKKDEGEEKLVNGGRNSQEVYDAQTDEE